MGRWDERYTERQRRAICNANLSRDLGGSGIGAGTVVKLAAAGELRDQEGVLEPFKASVSYVHTLRRREESRRGLEHRAAKVKSPTEALTDLARRMTISLATAMDRHEQKAKRAGKMKTPEWAAEVRELAKAGIEVERLARALHPQNTGPKPGHPGRAKDAPTSDVDRLLKASRQATEGDPSPDTNGTSGDRAPETEAKRDRAKQGSEAELPSGLALSGFRAAGAERTREGRASSSHEPSGHTSER